MNTETPSAISSDQQVLSWLLSVARRADATMRADVTTRVAAVSRDLARRAWLRAECEVFEQIELANADGLLRSVA